MKRSRSILILLVLMLAACTAIPTTEPGVPITGDGTPTSQAEGNPDVGQVHLTASRSRT